SFSFLHSCRRPLRTCGLFPVFSSIQEGTAFVKNSAFVRHKILSSALTRRPAGPKRCERKRFSALSGGTAAQKRKRDRYPPQEGGNAGPKPVWSAAGRGHPRSLYSWSSPTLR